MIREMDGCVESIGFIGFIESIESIGSLSRESLDC